MPLETRGARFEDPGAELLDRVNRTWELHGQKVLAGLGVVVALVAIAFFSLRARAAAEEQAAEQLAQANLLFWQGDYPRSLQLAKQVGERFASTSSGVDAHRIAGDDAFWSGDFKTSIAEYRTYLEKRKIGLLPDAVRRSLAYALESDQQYAQAVPLYEGLVGKFDRESSAEFLMAAARCYRLLGRPPDAVKSLRRLVNEFGETSYASRARLQLYELTGAAG